MSKRCSYYEFSNPAYDPLDHDDPLGHDGPLQQGDLLEDPKNLLCLICHIALTCENKVVDVRCMCKVCDDDLREIHEESVNEWHLRQMYDPENDEGD
jgi:hypothetical protein